MFGQLLSGLAKGAGNLYNQYIGNPLTAKVDAAIAPVANPIMGAYNSMFNAPAQHFVFNKPAQAAPTTMPQATPTATAQPTPQPQFGQMLTKQALLNGINKWTANNSQPVPITQNLDSFVQAGNDFAKQGLDPFMPTIMALRETQGGRDLNNPAYQGKIGDNNVFNIRNVRDAQGNIIGQPGNPKQFINYPDVNTAVVGGNGQGGLEGQILKSGIYGDFLKSKQMQDFFNHYSPPSNGNGPIPQQIDNYNYIRRFFQ